MACTISEAGHIAHHHVAIFDTGGLLGKKVQQDCRASVAGHIAHLVATFNTGQIGI
jgi:hypothetical protein